jgi:hypothetical protein
MARPILLGGGRNTPLRRTLARREQLVQLPLAYATRPRTKTPTEWRGNFIGRPPMTRQGVAPSTHRVSVPRDGTSGSRSLAPSRPTAWTRYNRQATLASHSLPDSLPARLCLRRGTISAIRAMFNTSQIIPCVHSYSTRAPKVRYKFEIAGCNNPWADSMRLQALAFRCLVLMYKATICHPST